MTAVVTSVVKKIRVRENRLIKDNYKTLDDEDTERVINHLHYKDVPRT